MQPGRPLRVLIADDQPLFVRRLELLLELEAKIEVVGSAKDGAEAVELAETLHPDVVLMDIEMPRLDGLQATAQIRAHDPATHVVMLTASESATSVARARVLGADYVMKSRIDSDLLSTILPTSPES